LYTDRDEWLFEAIAEFGRIGYLARHRDELKNQVGDDADILAKAFTHWDRAEAALLELHKALADIEIVGLIPFKKYPEHRRH
jgi:hypothetical protein